MQSNSSTQRVWQLSLLGLTTVTLFMLLHPYRGLVHDSRLYAVQALNHLHPELYGNDVFLRFGSQDDYTLFSPLFARLIGWMGLEPAAAFLTLGTMILFMFAVWILARTLLSAEQSWIALLLVVTVPAYYGSARVFHFLEEFATPRQLAEVLTLLAIATWLRGARLLAAGLAVAAMFIHPIIGLAGMVLLLTLGMNLLCWRRILPLVAAGALIYGLILLGWIPVSKLQFDAEWHELVMRRTYLGLRYWDSDDWGRVVTTVATLTIASTWLEGKLQALAAATLVTTCCLMLLSLVGGDQLHLVFVVQAQTWRVLWLATVVGLVLLPALFGRGWHATRVSRCSLLLLAAAWVAPHASPALVLAPLAVGGAVFAARELPAGQTRLLLAGAWSALSIVTLYALATSVLTWNDGLTQRASLPPTLDGVLTLLQNGILPALLVLAGAYTARRAPTPMTLSILSALLVMVIAFTVPHLAKTWTEARYGSDLHAAFADWRERIPPGSDVMWASEESSWGDGATNTWLLLNRPSFVSGAQSPNALFSRKAAIEMRNRAHSLWGLLPFSDRLRPAGQQDSKPAGILHLGPVCETSAVRYVVTEADFIDAHPIPAPESAPPNLRDFKLYICT